MINPSNAMKILADRVSNLLSSIFSTTSSLTASIINRYVLLIFSWIITAISFLYEDCRAQPSMFHYSQ